MAIPNIEQIREVEAVFAGLDGVGEGMPAGMSGLTEEEIARENSETNPALKSAEQEILARGFEALDEAVRDAATVDPKKFLAKTYSAAHSGNYTRGRQGNVVDTIVIHYMAGSYSSTLNWFADPRAKVSTTYSIAKDGRSAQHISESDTGWHTGVSPFSTQTRSIGIEHEGFGAVGDWTDAMLRESARICAGIIARHPRIKYVVYGWGGMVGHSSINSQKRDPGPNFPWKKHDALIAEFLKGSVSPSPEPKPEPEAEEIALVLAKDYKKGTQVGSYRVPANVGLNQAKLKEYGLETERKAKR